MALSHAQKSVVWIVLAVVLLLAVAGVLTLILTGGPGVAGTIWTRLPAVARGDATQPGTGDDPAADLPIEQFLPSELLKIDPKDAMARNLALPVARGVNSVAPPFVAQWLGPELPVATQCLATAVYYEAAGEPIAGQRAVAQVVLNRLRNPRYPKTICGVIYQGAERATGCQFSFACNGSTRRKPSMAGWAVATAVATAALNGVTSAEAGQSTHYHTLAVFPAWAPQLAKIGIIGHHVFYRPPGRATYGYDALPKAEPEPLPTATPVIDPLATSLVPAPAPPGNTVRGMVADAGHTDPVAATPPSSAQVAKPPSPADPRSQTPGAGASPASEPRRSMFPTRQRHAPNLPLTS